MLFQHTKTALNEIQRQLKKYALICHITIQSIIIAYLLYNLIALSNLKLVNAALLFISITYFIYYLVTTFKKLDKTITKKIKSIKQFTILMIKFIPFCLSIYTLWGTIEYLDSFSIILMILQVISWILQVVFLAISFMMGSFISLLLTGLDADLNLKTKAGAFFSKITRTEENLDPELQLLYKIEKDKKNAKKQAKKQAKLEEKTAKKKNKRIPAPIEELASANDDK